VTLRRFEGTYLPGNIVFLTLSPEALGSIPRMGPCGISKPIPGIRNSQTSTRFPLRAVRVIIGDALLLTQFPWLQLGNDRNLQGEWRGC